MHGRNELGYRVLFKGDCLRAMQQLLDDGCAGQVHAVICDPPYGIGFGGEVWDGPENVTFRTEVWSLAHELLAPGGHLIAFGAARTYHRLATAVEAAGFEIRDQLMWLYGTGTPVVRDVSRDVDLLLGAVREQVRIPWTSSMGNTKARALERPWQRRARELGYHETDGEEPVTPEATRWAGYGTQLKPCHEPIVLARKPLSHGSVAANLLAHGTGALDLGRCRRIAADGVTRHPGNVLHDGSDTVVEAFPVSARGTSAAEHFGAFPWEPEERDRRRFFYHPKAGTRDRTGHHPTQKPLALMRWLVRLICPENGVVLDPFCGSGTTLEAAVLEGRFGLGCELTPDYWPDIEARVLRGIAASERLPVLQAAA